MIEKLAYSLLMASRKLRQYFQSHHITVLIDQPLKEVLQWTTTSGQMVKWSIELSEYGLEFQPKKSIKAQTLVDFVAECTFQKPQKIERQSTPTGSDQLAETDRQLDIWSIYIDGSSAQEEVRAGILLVGPNKEEFKCSIKYTFLITNNAVEYEALLAGLRLAKGIRADRVKAFTNSQLVVRQVIGEYEVKDSILKAYNGLVKQLWSKFSQIQLTQISREENSREDELSQMDPTDPKAIKGILVEVLNRPSIATKEVMTIDALD